ncbi:MAG: putative short-chain dehydrogenase [Idiomarinaceae bacterium HL-53]|nr:MAG: putative short-chain dehydrogenase [Idiomarinaceae bacterium HL-53]CUS47746.1 Short-chain dehydrogenase [Idiomarinaceae bacterium HL-53]
MKVDQQPHVFITGGANGLGFALAKHYLARGARVCIGDRDIAGGEQALESLRKISDACLFLPCDVTQSDALTEVASELMKTWGRVDIVINNAGVAQVGAIEDVSDDDWHWIIDINLMGVVRGCRAFTPLFKKQKAGYFINVASMAGLLDVPRMSAYNSTKAAVVSLSETLQHELAGDGIGVSVVCPSFFQTNLGASMRSSVPNMQDTLAKLMRKSDLTAEDVAKIIANAAENREFYILPHKKARGIWRLKKWLPRAWYARIMAKQTRGIRRK